MYATIDDKLYKTYTNLDRHESLDPLLNTAHTLIAGTTGSGKSVLLNSVLWSAMSKPTLFVFIDLKRVELRKFEAYQGCMAYVDEPNEVHKALQEVIALMEQRYADMQEKKIYQSADYPLYVVIDELADLITDHQALADIVKIGRLGRAANIHLLCATQDPSRRTLSAQLMQNFTCCVALRCKTAIESRQITGFPGAENLPRYGKGYLWDAEGIRKIDIPLTSDEQILTRIAILKKKSAVVDLPEDDSLGHLDRLYNRIGSLEAQLDIAKRQLAVMTERAERAEAKLEVFRRKAEEYKKTTQYKIRRLFR